MMETFAAGDARPMPVSRFLSPGADDARRVAAAGKRTPMTTCPSCHKDSPNDTECPFCGIFFAKWNARHGGATETPPLRPPEPTAAEERSWGLRLFLVAVVLGGGFWLYRMGAGSSEKKVRQAYLDFRKAIAAGDLAETRRRVASGYANEFEEAGAAAKLEIVKALTPGDAAITEITVNGGEAVVKARGAQQGMAALGTTRLVKEAGVWKVAKENWDMKMDLAAAGGSLSVSDFSLDPAFPSQANAEFDQVASLPGQPMGLAVAGNEWLVGNRQKPWGFIRLDAGGKNAKKIEVMDYSGGNPAGFDSVAWNGKEYVSLTGPGWYLPAASPLFNVHDPRTLKPLRHAVAPPQLGCLAWDGSGYWAATRLNTADSNDGAFIYQLDAAFKTLRTLESPAKGCQGLAWGGGHLWMADVFTDNIYVVNVDGPAAQTVRTYSTPLSYLSGLAFSGRDLLAAEYDNNRLWRLKERLLGAAAAGAALVQAPSPTGNGGFQSAAPTPGYQSPMDREYAEKYGKKAVPELLVDLKNEPFHKERILQDLIQRGAKVEAVKALNAMLRDKTGARSPSSQTKSMMKTAGAPVTFDWGRSFSSAPEENDFSLVEWEIEARGGALVTSGKVYVGRDVVEGFSRPQKNEFKIPTYAQYRFTVTGPGLAKPLQKTVDAEARAGEQSWREESLAAGLAPGEYQVALFLHAQTVKQDGTPVSLNNSPGRLTVESR